jgi:hypothetical protein
MKRTIAGIDIPDGPIAQAATDRIRSTESVLMFHHALRAFLFAALTGQRQGMTFNSELLYVAALFHNVGLNLMHWHSTLRFEIDSANAARNFLRQYRVDETASTEVWHAIALHTSPGIPEHMPALVALLSAGVQMDVRGSAYDDFTEGQRDEIVRAYPREHGFKNKIIEAYARGMMHRPQTTFGTVNADILDRYDANYRRSNFCGLVLGSEWEN